MVDILVRGVSEDEARALKSLAAREKRSLNDLVRETLSEKARAELKAQRWARISAVREEIGRLPDDSLDAIHEFRDRAW